MRRMGDAGYAETPSVEVAPLLFLPFAPSRLTEWPTSPLSLPTPPHSAGLEQGHPCRVLRLRSTLDREKISGRPILPEALACGRAPCWPHPEPGESARLRRSTSNRRSPVSR